MGLVNSIIRTAVINRFTKVQGLAATGTPVAIAMYQSGSVRIDPGLIGRLIAGTVAGEVASVSATYLVSDIQGLQQPSFLDNAVGFGADFITQYMLYSRFGFMQPAPVAAIGAASNFVWNTVLYRF